MGLPSYPDQPRTIILPNLVGSCPFPLRSNPRGPDVAKVSDDWLISCGALSPKQIASLRGRGLGLVAELCYPRAQLDELRNTCDFLNYLLHLDDLTDEMDTAAAMRFGGLVLDTLRHPETVVSETPAVVLARDFWLRWNETAYDGCKQRFIDSFSGFFDAVAQQSRDRKAGVVLDMDAYIQTRRDTGGVMMCFAAIEYANRLQLSDEVMCHPSIRLLQDYANDYVNWSNDLWSYNKEQAIGDTHNLVCVVMREQVVPLQRAIDTVGAMCTTVAERFIQERARLPRWGPEIDEQVSRYVDGLADWIVGAMHASFASDRYFGRCGAEIMRTRVVELYPRRYV